MKKDFLIFTTNYYREFMSLLIIKINAVLRVIIVNFEGYFPQLLFSFCDQL